MVYTYDVWLKQNLIVSTLYDISYTPLHLAFELNYVSWHINSDLLPQDMAITCCDRWQIYFGFFTLSVGTPAILAIDL